MLRIVLISVLAWMLSGCETFAPAPPVTEVEPGMNQAQVAALLGAPDARQVHAGGERWAYCMNGWVSDDHVVVEFDESARVSSSEARLDPYFFHCKAALRELDAAD